MTLVEILAAGALLAVPGLLILWYVIEWRKR